MTDVIVARIRAHQGNMQRYCRLLVTELTDTERQFIHNRIAEERAELERLLADGSHLSRPRPAPKATNGNMNSA